MITLKPNALFALTLPGKLQSYLACAKPILANLQGEGRRIVEETGAGFVSANGSIEAFVEIVMAMKKLTLEERQSMGQRGRDYFEKHFHRDALLQNLEQWMFRLKENNYK
ncbi:MAG: hypothetical protein H2069_00110 [Legionella sp.]|nr:hypothetical protein [Legionella sp.]